MKYYGVFKCHVCHQPYHVTENNLLHVTEHMRKHWKYEHVTEQWVIDRCITEQKEESE